MREIQKSPPEVKSSVFLKDGNKHSVTDKQLSFLQTQIYFFILPFILPLRSSKQHENTFGLFSLFLGCTVLPRGWADVCIKPLTQADLA